MLLLPKKVGPFTLMRRLGADGATESYTAILEDPAGKQVVARRIEPWLLEDPTKRTDLVNRVRDLEGVRHPTLISTLDYVVVDGEHYIISDWVDGVSLRQLLFWCMKNRQSIPHNIYLNIAAKVCNGLEALHSRPGAVSGTENTLHLGLSPECVILTPAGDVVVGVYGLVRSPTVSAAGNAAGVHRVEYLSPEQTHPDEALTPSTDIFSLGAVLYELLTLKPLFKAGSRLQTMHRIRRAEVTTQLLEVKELLPGLDKVLYRALSLNPRHRYQRAFVLREDLRGLMANYSFADIDEATREFLGPLIQAKLVGDTDEVIPHLGPDGPSESTDALLENSLQNLELPPGFFDKQESGEGGPELPSVSEQGYRPEANDTGALLRRANFTDGPPTDADALRQVPGSGTPAPQVRQAVPADLPEHEDPTDVPEPSIAQAPGPATEPIPEPAPEPTAPSTEAPAASAPPKKPEPAAQPEPTVPETEPAAASPSPPGAALESPVPAKRIEPAPEPDGDDFSDLDWQPSRGPSPIVVGIGIAAVVAVAGFGCFGIGVANLLGGRAAEPEAIARSADEGSMELAALDAEPEEPDAEQPDTEEAPPEANADEGNDAVAAVATPAPRPRLAPTPPPSPRPTTSPPPPPAPRPTPVPVPVVAAPPPPPPPPIEPEPAPEPILDPESAMVPDRFEDDAVALAELATDEPEPIPVEPGDLGELSGAAQAGALSDTDRTHLAGIDSEDPEYTRARVLLYEDAKARSDLSERRRQLDALMVLPENHYKPEYLVEQAQIALLDRDYETALDRAELAERHWARLPQALIFSRRAAIFEIQAAALTGLFYASDGEDMTSLERAIRVWEKYRRHVLTRERGDLKQHAETRIAKLEEMRERLQ